MPNTKRLKGSGATKAQKPSDAPRDAAKERPTPAEVEEEEHPFVQLARKHWLKPVKKPAQPKVKNDVLKQGIWDVLERDGFQYKSLRLLESLQTLERCVVLQKSSVGAGIADMIASSYLWPGYTDESSNFHVLLIALIVNVKRREQLETWSKLQPERKAVHPLTHQSRSF